MELSIIIQNVSTVLLCTIAFFKAAGQITKRVDDLTLQISHVGEVLTELSTKVTEVEHTYVTQEQCERRREAVCQKYVN
jgi:hypothetical protein